MKMMRINKIKRITWSKPRCNLHSLYFSNFFCSGIHKNLSLNFLLKIVIQMKTVENSISVPHRPFPIFILLGYSTLAWFFWLQAYHWFLRIISIISLSIFRFWPISLPYANSFADRCMTWTPIFCKFCFYFCFWECPTSRAMRANCTNIT